MKAISSFIIGLLVLATHIMAQNNAVIQITPQMPKVGTQVRITYNPAHQKAVLKNVSALTLVQQHNNKDFEQYAMTKQNGKWTAQMPISFGDTYSTFYVKSSGAEDKNEGHLWDVVAHDASGKSVKGAYYMRGFSYESRGYTKEEAERMKLADLKKEVAAHPDNFYPSALTWKAELDAATTDAAKTATKTKMKQALDALWATNKGKFDYFSGIQTVYRIAGLTAEADAFKQSVLNNQPSAEILQRNQFSDVLRTPKGQSRCDKLTEFITKNGVNSIPIMYANSLFDSYLNCKDEAKTLMWADKVLTEEYSKLSPSRTLSRFAQLALTAQMNDMALGFAQKAIAAESKEFFADFMRKTSETTWQPTSLAGDKLAMAKDNLHGENLKTLGKIYIAKNNFDEAISALKQASSLLQNDKDIFPTLANAYETKGDLQGAFDLYFTIAKKDRTDEKALANLKRLHEKIKGSADGFADVTANLERIWATKPTPVYSVPEYGITRDPEQDLLATVAQSKQAGGKTIMLFVGGEWCTWCHALTRFFKQNETIATALQDNYIIMKVNYSTENENKAFLGKYPAISGYPHLYFLDGNGKLIHSQDTGSIESGIGMGYDEAKIMAILNRWSPARIQGGK